MGNGFISAMIVFFFCFEAVGEQAFRSNGQVAGYAIFGGIMYTCVVWVVNLQMALAVSYFTLIQHVLIWGSIATWYLFLIVYGAMSPKLSTTAYMVFLEALVPSPSYWLVTLFVTISALVPYFTFSAIQMRFFPMYHGKIQWIRHEGFTDNVEYCDMVRQGSLRPTTVGHTARLAAKSRRVQNGDFGQR